MTKSFQNKKLSDDQPGLDTVLLSRRLIFGWYVASIYLILRPIQPSRKLVLPQLPTRLLIRGWYCLRSYQSHQFFDTKTNSGLYTRVSAWYSTQYQYKLQTHFYTIFKSVLHPKQSGLNFRCSRQAMCSIARVELPITDHYPIIDHFFRFSSSVLHFE